MTVHGDELNRPAWEAARLALLALRGSIHTAMRLAPDTYALATEPRTVLAADAVVPLLVSAPKPLICRSTASGGAVVLHLGVPVKRRSLEWISYVSAVAHFDARNEDPTHSLGAALHAIVERLGVSPAHVQALCAARDEMILLPVDAIERWEREYIHTNGGYALDDVDNPLAAEWPVYQEARKRNAACVLRLGELHGAVT